MEEKSAPAQSSWFWDALGEAGTFALRLLKRFVVVYGIEVVYCGIVAIRIFFLASDGKPLRGLLAAGLTFVIGALAAVWLGGQLSIVLSLADTVRAKHVGRRILDVLFARLMGVTDAKPEGDLKLTQKLHGLPVKDVEATLNEAARAVLEHRLALAAVPRIALWLANKAQQVLVWATVYVVTRYCTKGKSPEELVDLLALRQNLAEVVDDLLAEKLVTGAIRLALLVAALLVIVGWLLASGVHWLWPN
jgi:hypothetical protein